MEKRNILLFLTVLTMCLLDVSSLGSSDFPTWYTKHSSKHCGVNDNNRLLSTTVKNAKECAQLCDKVSGCVALSYSRPQKHCVLMKSCHSLTSKTSTDTYILKLRIPIETVGPIGKLVNYDKQAVETTHQGERSLIKALRIYYFLHQNKDHMNGKEHQHLTGLRFIHNTHGDYGVNPLNKDRYQELLLGPGEFITEVKLQKTFLYISWLQFKTSAGRTVSAGNLRNAESFTYSGNGGPLLYASVNQGIYLYQVRFTFMTKQVSSPEMITEYKNLAKEIYDTWNEDVEKLPDMYMETRQFLPDMMATECHWYDSKKEAKYELICQMSTIFQQLAAVVTNTQKYKAYQPRLLEFGNYDTDKFLDLKRVAKQFRTVMTGIQLTVQESTDVTVEVGTRIGNYFRDTGAIDLKLAEADRDVSVNRLRKLKEKHAGALKKVGDKLGTIMAVALSALSADVITDTAFLAAKTASACNPFNGDWGAVAEQADKLAASIAQVQGASILLASLSTYTNQVKELHERLKDNEKQQAFISMKEAIEKFDTATADQQKEMAAKFLTGYSDYAAVIFPEDLDKMAASLQALASTACTYAKKADSGVGTGISVAADENCITINGDVAYLNTINQQLHSEQFKLIDTFAAIVRGNIAVTMASKIEGIKNSIDLTTATIGSLMIELQFQAAAQAVCDEKEYAFAGFRPKECKHLFFTITNSEKITSFDGHAMTLNKFSQNAFLPTMPSTDDPSLPWMNITEFLSGQKFVFTLPSQEWGLANDWFRTSHVTSKPLSAYYVKDIELYIPDVRCKGGANTDVIIEAVASEDTKLFFDNATLSYSRNSFPYSFSYNYDDVASCTADVEKMRVRLYEEEEEEGRMNNKRTDDVCVTSKGRHASDNTQDLASLLSTWTFQMKTENGCELEHFGSQQPMATVKLFLFQRDPKKLDLCWPYTRCPLKQVCHTDGLTYSCTDTSPNSNK